MATAPLEERWGRAPHRQLELAGLTCVAVIENNASTRKAAIIPSPHFSFPEYIAGGPAADAVLPSLLGDHDRELLSTMQRQLGSTVPALSWKMLFSLLSDPDARSGLLDRTQ